MYFLRKKILLIIIIIIIPFNILSIEKKIFNVFINGKHYITLPLKNSKELQIIEFFSFFCPHCYQFDCVYHFNDILKKQLPKNIKFIKYHVNFLGGRLGYFLTHIWAVAISLKIENKVLIPIFDYINKEKKIDEKDLKKIFIQTSGISLKKYNVVWNSMSVKLIIKKQNNILKTINLKAVPGLLINGKYMINIAELNNSSLKNFLKDYINISKFLISKKHTY